MSNYLLRKKSKDILKQMNICNYSEKLTCSIIKVLRMRHKDLDISQANMIVKDILHEKIV
ncbi:MAG: hypothetical protein QM493_00900 [Sulfurovum sp.]